MIAPLQQARRGVVVALVCSVPALLVAGCSDRGPGADTSSNESSSPTATAEPLSGDPDSRFCELASTLITPDLAESPEDLKAFYRRFDTHSEEFLAEAPEQIADDVEIFVAGVTALRERLEAVDYDAAEVDPESVPELRSAGFPEAGRRITAYNEQVCDAD